MVMFDLPVETKSQRREATAFRNLLLDNGYQRAQYSVYVRFSPSIHSILPTIGVIKNDLPSGGEVRIVFVTDHQWAKALRFCDEVPRSQERSPDQLTIF
ncbi:CRISPR-associated endonuclease Cas2 [Propionimicrobium sp. PCR01-08-3]|uniref:CRISPR-associated endonuclease Cas2 n=1 Tax=Propionimicrobium sp. PCR01-08-3 TaxID=3052086 RepID=UPI00255C3DF8|nr:CRISPR-associated endonuclease Cas2 [Propionimicrobium sp. PCR01-08-3]WIY81811.1 CRISPR-associated endonuclease Cas2 [Propionimicrobium sp. PCR01-08-3]